MSRLLTRRTQLRHIIHKTGREPCDYKYSLCKMRCHTPCFGTPQDIGRLTDAGYADKLVATLWGTGMVMGIIDILVLMIQAVAGDEYCVFYHNELCELHNKGLKPTEGHLSHHSIRPDSFKVSKSVAQSVAKEWLSVDSAEVIGRIANKLDRNLNTRKL